MSSGCETYLSFIQSQVRPAGKAAACELKRAVTISRQSGCGAHAIAEKLAQYLQDRSPKAAAPWTVFDRNLMERVLTDHNLPERIAKFMPEDRVSEIEDAMDELFGLRPAAWTLVQQTSETILHLASLGNVILLGRGANIVTAKQPGAVHVRLVGSVERRVAAMQEFDGLTRKAALERIRREDLGRQRYFKKYFGKDIADPLLYHLVLNTDLLSSETAARLIGDTVLGVRAE
ncbi:MAG: cytidylate kinase-like family protein [Verrucomicrobia bacterium]|nr:cytidylate kinase-like family protein [Verrucomicrobiota bacterium]